MPSEYIGNCGIGELPNEGDWVIGALEIDVAYLRSVAPDPLGYEAGVMWQDHGLGSYPGALI